MPLKKKIFLAVSLLYILYTVVPIIPDITGIEVWIVNLFTFIILFTMYPRAFANPVFYWFLAYAAILAIYILVGKPLTIGIGNVADSKKIIIEYAFMLPSLSIFNILLYLKDKRLYRIISVISLSFLILSFIYIIPFILSQNTILRDAYHLELYENINMQGMPGYPLMHAYTLTIPAILYGIRILNNIQKWALVLIAVLFIFIILHTYVTTSIITTFSVIVFSLLYNTKNKLKSYLLIFFVCIFVYFLHLSGVFVQMFDFLIHLFEGTAVQPKMEGFKYIYLNGDIENSGGDITGRISFHDMSWLAFKENIFIGGTTLVGGHSSLIDRLGGLGLLGFIPFLMIILSQIRRWLLLIKDKEQRLFYYLGLGVTFILLYEKGLFGQEGWLFLMVLLPGLIVSFGNKSKIK